MTRLLAAVALVWLLSGCAGKITGDAYVNGTPSAPYTAHGARIGYAVNL